MKNTNKYRIAAAASRAVVVNDDGTVITANEELDISDWKDIIAVSVANKSTVVGLQKDGL